MSNYDGYGTPSRPDSNCRTCTDFKFWSKQQQRQIFNDKDTSKLTEIRKSSSNGQQQRREDCPMDKSALGHATWGLLHSMAAVYSDNPTDTQKRDAKRFIEALSRVYPCEYCAADFRTDLEKNPVNANSQHELSQWLCNFHNRVNLKLGKQIFDCSKVNERWRDGWLDGSCD